MYLNQQLFQARPVERQALADAIARMSPMSWQHINLQGEFDFSDEALTDALRFDLGALLTVEWKIVEGEGATPPNATFGPNF